MAKFTILVLSLIAIFPTIAQTRNCYVCGIGASDPFINYKEKLDIPLSCVDLEKPNSNMMDNFILTCPPNYVGCITLTDGTRVTKTCDSLAINDCKIANGVEYCYCDTDLCNKFRKPINVADSFDKSTTDDEDILFESSGSKNYDDKNAEDYIAEKDYEDNYDSVLSTTTTTDFGIIRNNSLTTSSNRTINIGQTTTAIIPTANTSSAIPTSTDSTQSIFINSDSNLLKLTKLMFIFHIVFVLLVV